MVNGKRSWTAWKSLKTFGTPVLSLPQFPPAKKPILMNSSSTSRQRKAPLIYGVKIESSPWQRWQRRAACQSRPCPRSKTVSAPPAWICWLSSPRRSAVTWKTLSNMGGVNEKLYWYDSQPHPDEHNLKSTYPHHKHVRPDMKHHRIPAPLVSFSSPNLSELVKEIAESL